TLRSEHGDQFDVEKLTRLRLVLGKLGRLLRQQSDTELTHSQLSLLFAIERCEPISPGDLAAAEGVRPPSITRSLSRLEELGLVNRELHADDRRSSVITLTRAGAAACDRARRLRAMWLSDRVAHLTPEAQAQLAATLPVLERLGEPPAPTGGSTPSGS